MRSSVLSTLPGREGGRDPMGRMTTKGGRSCQLGGALEEIGGKKDILVGKLQQKYGYASDEADRRADEWAKHQDKPDEAPKA